MRSYETARSLFSFLAFCAWSVVILGVLVALIGAGGGSRYGGAGAGLLAMAPGIGIGISGLILVAFVQMGRANVDTAEYTQQMLKVSRDQLEVSRQGLKQGAELAGSFSALQKREPFSESESQSPRASIADVKAVSNQIEKITPEEFINYEGKKIVRFGDQFILGQKCFQNLESAKQYVDVTLAREQSTPPARLDRQAVLPVSNAMQREGVTTPNHEVVEQDGRFAFGSMTFATREAADKYAAQMGINPNLKS